MIIIDASYGLFAVELNEDGSMKTDANSAETFECYNARMLYAEGCEPPHYPVPATCYLSATPPYLCDYWSDPGPD